MGLGGCSETGRFISGDLGCEFRGVHDFSLHHNLTMETSVELGWISRFVLCWIGKVSEDFGEMVIDKLISSAHATRSWGGLV
jgi:hypothetical protein